MPELVESVQVRLIASVLEIPDIYDRMNSEDGLGFISVVDVFTKEELEDAVNEHRCIWQLGEDGHSFGELLFDGDKWLTDDEFVSKKADSNSIDESMSIATKEQVDAVSEIMLSEVELLAQSVAQAVPDNADLQLAIKRFNNKTRIARAALAAHDAQTLDVLAKSLSDNDANNAVTVYEYKE